MYSTRVYLYVCVYVHVLMCVCTHGNKHISVYMYAFRAHTPGLQRERAKRAQVVYFSTRCAYSYVNTHIYPHVCVCIKASLSILFWWHAFGAPVCHWSVKGVSKVLACACSARVWCGWRLMGAWTASPFGN